MKKLHVTLSLALFASIAGLCPPQFAQGGGGRSDWNLTHVCTYCHDPHGNINPFNLLDSDIEVLCLTCHGPGGTSSLKADVHVGGATCVTCHDQHMFMTNWKGGVNLSTVGVDNLGLARINTPWSGIREVVFESRGSDVAQPTLYSFADGDQDGDGYYDGVCETCHTAVDTTKHRNDASGDHSHYVGDTCTRCHPHEDGFLPTGGGCTDCHKEPRGTGTYAAGTMRRAVVDNLDTGGTIEGDFRNSIGGHHIGTDPTNYVCAVCHREGIVNDGGTPSDPSDDTIEVDSNYHNAGTAPYTVDLRNVDDANASYPVRTDPTSWPAGAGPNGTYGNPTNVYKNNLTEFCLGCHDSDGASVVFSVDPAATGSATDPFGDGASPLNVYQKFLTTNFSSHAIASQKDANFGPMYAGDWQNPGDPGIKAGSFVNGWGSASVTECADCHLGEDPAGTPSYYHNGHGGRNLNWLLLDKNGLDQIVDHGSSAPDESADGTVLCFRCHDPVTYTSSPAAFSRFDPHSQNGHPDSAQNPFEIGCLNCHGGDTLEPIQGGTLVKGGIHGTNRSDDIDLDKNGIPSGNPYNRLRFTNGAALDLMFNFDADPLKITCSTQRRPAFGHNVDCTQHTSKDYTRNYD